MGLGNVSESAASNSQGRPIVGGRLRQLIAWLPALILPAATAEQLRALLAADVLGGASALTWALFFLANVGALFLGTAETPLARVQMALAFGVTAGLDLILVAVILLG